MHNRRCWALLNLQLAILGVAQLAAVMLGTQLAAATPNPLISLMSPSSMEVANVSAVEELAKAGIKYIVYWSEEQPGSQLIAAHFGHAFCAALRNPVTTIPEVPWCLHH